MQHDIFISYTQPNRNEACSIHDMLQANGLKSWIAISKNNGIPTGEYFESEIVKVISGCKVIVLIYSAFCNASEHIIKELRHKNKGQKLIVFRLDYSEFNNELSYHLKGLQHIDACGNNWTDAVNRLLNSIMMSVRDYPSPGTTTTDQLLLSNGLKLMENKIYQEAVDVLNQYLKIAPHNDLARFYLALGIIAGRKARKLDGTEVKKLENILIPSLSNPDNGGAMVLLAIIKYGYYVLNGFREKPPTVDQLLDTASLDRKMANEILNHIYDPENQVWVSVSRLFQQ